MKKKLLFLLMTMLAIIGSQSAFASPDLYLRGSMNSWGTDNNYKFTQTGNVYTLTLTETISASDQWKIADKDWGGGGFDNNSNTTIKYESGNTNYIDKVDGNLTSNIDLPAGTKFTFNYNTSNIYNSTLSVVIPGTEPIPTVTKVEIYNSNNSHTQELTLQDNGKWTIAGFVPSVWAKTGNDNTNSKAKYRIRVTTDLDGTTSTTDYTTVDAANTNYWLTETTPYKMVRANGGWFLIGGKDGKTNVDIILTMSGATPSAIQLNWKETTDPDDPVDDYPTLYLRGSMNNTEWAAKDEYKFNRNENVYTLTLAESILASDEWKIATENWGNIFNNVDNTTIKYESGSTNYVNVVGNDKNLTSNVDLPVGTTFTLTYDNTSLYYSTLSVVIPGTEPAPTVTKVELYNSTNSNINVLTLQDDGTWTITGFIPESWANNDNGKSKYRIRVTTDTDGVTSTTDYTTKEGNNPTYWLDSSNPYNMVKAGTGWFLFKELDGKTNVDISLTFNGVAPGKMQLQWNSGLAVEYPDLYLRGEWVGNWDTANESNKFTREENVYTFTIPEGKTIAANSSWKIAPTDVNQGFTKGENVTIKYQTGSTNFFKAAGGNMASQVDLPAGTTFTFTYDVADINRSTLLVVILGTEPQPELTKVEIYNHNGSQTMELNPQDDGSWTIKDFVPEAWASDDGNPKSEYRIRVTTELMGVASTNDYTTVEATNTNYWLTTTTPYNMVRANGGWFNIQKHNGMPHINITVAFSGNEPTTIQLNWTKNEELLLEDVNMPLKASAFKSGRAHYFLVGFRTAAWRLQPEWELTKDANGKFTLNNQRLMYSQYFGIAKVDNYDDYIHQRFTLYWAPETLKDKEGTVELSGDPRQTKAYESGGTNDFTDDKTLTWLVGSEESSLTEDALSMYTPVLLENFEVTVDASGNPTELYYKANTTAKEVNKHRTFSLVGSQIKPSDEITIGGRTAPITHFTHSFDQNGGVEAWANSWIQYDDNGNPYVDANGHVLFQTAFDKDWLPNHPSNFDITITDGEESTVFTYDSSVITFENVASMSDDEISADPYYPLYDRIINHEGNFDFENTDMDADGLRSVDLQGTNFQFKEKFSYPEGDESDLKSTVNLDYDQASWHCFVVKDAWMSGGFKIWSGWGGNLKLADGGTDDNSMRWFVDNGGHGKKEDKAVEGGPITNASTSTLYGTRMDVPDANFHVVDNTYEEGVTDLSTHNPLVYYKRVILWYNEGKYGMNSAVLQLITEPLAPSVLATRRGKNDIGYRWNIPAMEGIDATEKVIKVAIERHTLNGNTVVAAKSVPSHYNPATENDYLTANELAAWHGYYYETGVAPGTYEYEIQVWYEGEDVEAPSIHTGVSNTVKIYAAAQPVNLKAAQRKEGNKFSFDLVLTPTINETVISRKVEGVSGMDMAKEIVIAPADEYTKTAVAAARDIECGNWTYNAAEGTFTLGVDALDDEFNLDPITIRDIAPNAGLNVEDQEYSFTATLKRKEDANESYWVRINFSAAKASGSIEAPTVKVYLSEPKLVAINTTQDRDDIANGLAVDETAHKFLPAGSHISTANGMRLENPAVYTLFNEVIADATVSSLAVTQSVKDYWSVTNRFSVNGTIVTLEPNQYPSAITFHGIPVKYKDEVDINEIEEDMRYTLEAGDMVALAKASVAYSRAGVEDAPLYITPASPGSTKKFSLNLGEPKFTIDEKTWFQHNHAEPNSASPQNNRAIATAQFDGYVTGLVEGLNYYVGYHFTLKGMDELIANLSNLKSGANENVCVYQSIIDGKAAQGGRIIGRRGAGEGATGGKNLVKALDFDYLYSSNYEDDNAYIQAWNVANNSWTHASKAENNRIPIEISPIAIGEYGADLSEQVSKVEIEGSVSVVYPIYDKLSVTNSTPAPQSANGMHKANQEAEADHERSITDYSKVVGLSVDGNGSLKLPVELSADDKVTGIDTIAADSINDDVEIYTLQGIRVAKPAPGNFYIIRQGAEATKVLCK